MNIRLWMVLICFLIPTIIASMFFQGEIYKIGAIPATLIYIPFFYLFSEYIQKKRRMKKNSTNSESDSQNSEEVHDEKIEDNHLGEESASLPPEDHITEIKPCAVSTMNPLPQKRRTISFWAAMTFGILFVVSVIACIILYYDNFLLQAESANQISVLQEENEKLRSNYEYQLSLRNDTEKENEELKEEISDIRDNIDLLGSRLEEVLPEYYFYHNGAVMITETGSKYHRYGCQYVEGRTYWIYNVELAIYEGYTPCSVCNPPRG